jgi:hypothetical protein
LPGVKKIKTEPMLKKNILLMVITGCANYQSMVKPPEVPKNIQDSELIEPPIEERIKLPEQTGVPIVLNKGIPAPYNGILIDERKATEEIAIRAERDRRRNEVLLLKRLDIQKDYLYRKALYDSYRSVEENSSNWWERNKGSLGFIGGMLVGGGIAIGMAYAVSGTN